jgi:hypothetical protein
MMYDSDEEIKTRIRGEWISNNLRPCDNFVVPTPTDEPFWCMQMDKGTHTILESFENDDKNEWTARDVVVRGYLYEKLQFSS